MNITVIICLLLAVTSYILGIRQLMEKGILLNNAWLYASAEERKTMDKKPHYRQSGIIFCFIGTIFTSDALFAITGFKQALYFSYVLVAITVIYAVVSSVHIYKNA